MNPNTSSNPVNTHTRRAHGAFVGALLIVTLSLGIVVMPALYTHDFFFMDDAQNAFFGFYREMGRLWLSGHLPVLTTRTLLGGNILVDMVLSPFSPQTIVASILSVKTGSVLLVADCMALMNVLLIVSGGYWLGRILELRQGFALLLGFTAATTPIVFQIYLTSWWNCGESYAWMAVCIPAFMNLRNRLEPASFSVATISTIFLFLSAGTHAQLIFLITVAATVAAEWVANHSFRRCAIIAAALLCAILISAVPTMSEYIADRDYILRSSYYSSNGNFLIANWGHVFNIFNPFYGTYILWFGGYAFVPLSMAYCGLFCFVPLFFKIPSYHVSLKSPEFRIMAIGALASLLLSFLPSQFGPLRWSFRSLPEFVFFISAISLYQLEHWRWRRNCPNPTRWAMLIAGVWGILQLFSSENSIFTRTNILYSALLAILLLICASAIPKGHAGKPGSPADDAHLQARIWIATIIAFAASIIHTPSLCPDYLPCTALPDTVLKENRNPEPGFDLQLASLQQLLPTPVKLRAEHLWDLESAQMLSTGQSSINGYSPVGHSSFSDFFPSGSAQGYFDPHLTLINISRIDDELPGTPLYRVFDIRRIYAWKKDITPDISSALDKSGLTSRTDLPDGRLLIEPDNPSQAEGTLTYQSAGHGIKHVRDDGPRHEWFDVQPSALARRLVFARIIWPGYHAELDGAPLSIGVWKGLLVSIDLPPGRQGKLHIFYEPVSWRYTRFSLLFGVALLLFMVGHLYRGDRGSTTT